MMLVNAIAIRFVRVNWQPDFVLIGEPDKIQLAQNLEGLNFKITLRIAFSKDFKGKFRSLLERAKCIKLELNRIVIVIFKN